MNEKKYILNFIEASNFEILNFINFIESKKIEISVIFSSESYKNKNKDKFSFGTLIGIVFSILIPFLFIFLVSNNSKIGHSNKAIFDFNFSSILIIVFALFILYLLAIIRFIIKSNLFSWNTKIERINEIINNSKTYFVLIIEINEHSNIEIIKSYFFKNKNIICQIEEIN